MQSGLSPIAVLVPHAGVGADLLVITPSGVGAAVATAPAVWPATDPTYRPVDTGAGVAVIALQPTAPFSLNSETVFVQATGTASAIAGTVAALDDPDVPFPAQSDVGPEATEVDLVVGDAFQAAQAPLGGVASSYETSALASGEFVMTDGKTSVVAAVAQTVSTGIRSRALAVRVNGPGGGLATATNSSPAASTSEDLRPLVQTLDYGEFPAAFGSVVWVDATDGTLDYTYKEDGKGRVRSAQVDVPADGLVWLPQRTFVTVVSVRGADGVDEVARERVVGSACMSDAPNMKPRSVDVTDGLEKAAARGMLRAVGMGDEDFAKPQIGVASSWNEITPCNLSLDRLADSAKDGVHAAGGYPLEFGTISVSDGISMGHEGMHFSLVSREVIADSVETVMMAERLDGSVLLAGCDKSLARHADGRRAARPRGGLPLRRLDHARARHAHRRHEPRGHDHRRLRGRRRLRPRADQPRGRRPASSARSARARAPAAACTPPTRWPPPPRRSACRCPGSAAPPAVDRRRDGYARRSGEAVVGMLRQGITARDVMTHRGVRERHRRRHGAGRLDQRGAAPARHRPRGRGRPDPRRLQPDRRQASRTSPT